MGILDDAIRQHLELKRRHGANDDEVARQEAEALGPARRPPAGEPGFEASAVPPPDPDAAASLTGDAPPPPEAGEPLQVDEGEEMPPPPAPGDAYAAPALDPEAAEPTEVFDPEAAGDLEPGFDAEPQFDSEQPLEEEPRFEQEPAAYDEPALHAEPSAEDSVAPPGEPEFRADEPVLPPDDAGAEPEPFDPPTEIASDDATRVRRTVQFDDPSLPPEPALPREPEPEPFEPSSPPPAAEGEGDGEDVLEETPEFLQDTPEHDRLWFEQKPPRDFDFDD